MKAYIILSLVIVALLFFASCTKGTDPSGGEATATALTTEQAIELQRTTAPNGEISQTFDGIEFVWIPAGSFVMGDEYAKPAHRVTLSKGFWLGKYEVTQAQWQSVMRSNPASFKGDDLPVETVSWNDCQAFIQRLNDIGNGKYRLPTEAEWEYACRAGTTAGYSFGDSYTRLGDYAWYRSNSGGKTHNVGEKRPNAWTLYDMHGNVYEWCSNWYGKYSSASEIEPKGAVSGKYRVLRGGSCMMRPGDCRSATRGRFKPSAASDINGFRICRTADE